jgi:hypothetical protein
MGCSGTPEVVAPVEVSSVDAGTVLDVSVVPTSFNERIKTTVNTTRGTFLIYGHFSAMKGTPVKLVNRGDKGYWLDVGNKTYKVGGM